MMTATEKIDDYIGKANDWRGDLITKIRHLIHMVEPEITEEWKWNVPVFSHKGKMVCSTAAFKNHVGLNFFNGAILEDKDQLFNGGLDAKKSRSIKFQKKDSLKPEPLKRILKEAIDKAG